MLKDEFGHFNKYEYCDEKEAKEKEKLVSQKAEELYQAIMSPVKSKNCLLRTIIGPSLNENVKETTENIDELVWKLANKEIDFSILREMNKNNKLTHQDYHYIWLVDYFYNMYKNNIKEK